MRWIEVRSPIGPLAVASDDRGVCLVRFAGSGARDAAAEGAPAAAECAPAAVEGTPAAVEGTPAAVEGSRAAQRWLTAAAAQLGAYFQGTLTEFDLPLAGRGGSDFERAVWEELRRIPYGDARSYGQVAAAVGDPGAARAVGVACNRNPLPLLVPCHRVVGAGGKLVGFGGGLPRKRFLLELESRVAMEAAWR